MYLQNCRCFPEHLRMLLQSLRALCFAPGGPGSIWNYLGAPVTSTGVSGRFACGFRTDLHFADVHSMTGNTPRYCPSLPCIIFISLTNWLVWQLCNVNRPSCE